MKLDPERWPPDRRDQLHLILHGVLVNLMAKGGSPVPVLLNAIAAVDPSIAGQTTTYEEMSGLMLEIKADMNRLFDLCADDGGPIPPEHKAN